METAAASLDVSLLCSRCSKDLDTEGSPNWCKACRAKYQREYKELIAKRTSERAFNAGVEAMRQTLAMEFSRHGRVMLSGQEVAFAINNSPRPQIQITELQPDR